VGNATDRTLASQLLITIRSSHRIDDQIKAIHQHKQAWTSSLQSFQQTKSLTSTQEGEAKNGAKWDSKSRKSFKYAAEERVLILQRRGDTRR
jgi:hypothetical protein